jgi:hypothetical protein
MRGPSVATPGVFFIGDRLRCQRGDRLFCDGGALEPVPGVTINDILAQHLKGRTLNFVSIDVEGMEQEVLSAST